MAVNDAAFMQCRQGLNHIVKDGIGKGGSIKVGYNAKANSGTGEFTFDVKKGRKTAQEKREELEQSLVEAL